MTWHGSTGFCSCCGCFDRVIEKAVVKLSYYALPSEAGFALGYPYGYMEYAVDTYEVEVNKTWDQLRGYLQFVLGSRGLDNSIPGPQFYETKDTFTFSSTPWLIGNPLGLNQNMPIAPRYARSAAQWPTSAVADQEVVYPDSRFLVNNYDPDNDGFAPPGNLSYPFRVTEPLTGRTIYSSATASSYTYPGGSISRVQTHQKLGVTGMLRDMSGSQGSTTQTWINRNLYVKLACLGTEVQLQAFIAVEQQFSGSSRQNRVYRVPFAVQPTTPGLGWLGFVGVLAPSPCVEKTSTVMSSVVTQFNSFPWGESIPTGTTPRRFYQPMPRVSVYLVYAQPGKPTPCSRQLVRVPDDPTFSPRRNVVTDDPIQISKCELTVDSLTLSLDASKPVDDPELLVTDCNATSVYACVDKGKQIAWSRQSTSTQVGVAAFNLTVLPTDAQPWVEEMIEPILPSNATSGEIIAVYRSSGTFTMISDPFGFFAVSTEGVVTFTGNASDAASLSGAPRVLRIRAALNGVARACDVVVRVEDTIVQNLGPIPNQVLENISGSSAAFSLSVPSKTINQWGFLTNRLGLVISSTGVVTRGTAIDAERIQFSRVVVRARDTDGLFYFRSCVVRVADANDFSIAVSTHTWANQVVSNVVPGTIVAHVRHTDNDISNRAVFSLTTNPSNAFAIDSRGDIRLVSALPDGTYSITARSDWTDGSNRSSTVNVVIGNSPTTVITDTDSAANEVTDGYSGEVPIQAAAFNASHPNRVYTYGLFDDSFAQFIIDADTGRVRTRNRVAIADGDSRTIAVGAVNINHTNTTRLASNELARNEYKKIKRLNDIPSSSSTNGESGWYADFVYRNVLFTITVRRIDGVLTATISGGITQLAAVAFDAAGVPMRMVGLGSYTIDVTVPLEQVYAPQSVTVSVPTNYTLPSTITAVSGTFTVKLSK